MVSKFLNYIKIDPWRIKKSHIAQYLYYLQDKHRSQSTLNVTLMAIKFYMENILNKKFFVRIPCSKKEKRLPRHLTKEEVRNLISSINNPKQKLMIKLLYSAGLRVGELVKLRVEDLNIDNGFGYVRHGKGRKDRIFIIAESVKDELMEYIKTNNLTDLIFPGQRCNYSTRSIQEVVKKASKLAGLKDVQGK
jgi:site-specific recombinase XerD